MKNKKEKKLLRKDRHNFIALLSFMLLSTSCFAQNLSQPEKDSADIYRHRKQVLYITGASAYTGIMVGLGYLWYADAPRTSFHFYNDNAHWLQVDKLGHIYTAYHYSRASMPAYRWAGYSEKKARILSGLTGFILQTPIEILDGFSAQYGASWGDIIANASGSGLFIGQQLLWGEERITPSFSFSPSPYAAKRPDFFGRSVVQQLIKDYNGQTHWFDFKLGKFSDKLPEWLELSIGYTGVEMVYGSPEDNSANGYSAYRQYHLSGSINFDAFHTNSNFVKSVFFVLDMIKIPFPSVSYDNRNGFMFHPLYF